MSNIIDSIQLSGVTYGIKGSGGNPTVELTQAEYDALVTAGTVSADTYYIITDAQAGDLTNYYTKTETDNAITAATSTKQDTLVSGTNIKTINNESILGSGNIDIQGGGGGSIIIDPSFDSGSTNAVANSAITQEFRDVAHFKGASEGYLTGVTFGQEDEYPSGKLTLSLSKPRIKNNGLSTTVLSASQWLYVSSINGKRCFSTSSSNVKMFNLVETSAITTSISSSSTDAQVPSAKAVYDIVGNIETLLSQI